MRSVRGACVALRMHCGKWHAARATPLCHVSRRAFLPGMFAALLLLALGALTAAAHGGHGLHHGHHHGEEVSPSGGGDAHATWGAGIAWRSLAEGKAEALATGKPLMLLVWKTWCGACKSLRPRFAGSAAIAAAASDVVMVNLVDDEEPAGNDALYKPEGAGYSACARAWRLPVPRPAHPPPPSFRAPSPPAFSPAHPLLHALARPDGHYQRE